MTNVYKYILTTFLLVVSIFMIGIGGIRVARFYMFMDNFSVVDSYLACERPLNNRCVLHYRISRLNGELSDFVPFGSQFNFQSLEKGDAFQKDRFGFSYQLNHKLEYWPSLWAQILNMILGIIGVVLWSVVGGPRAIQGWAKLRLSRRGTE